MTAVPNASPSKSPDHLPTAPTNAPPPAPSRRPLWVRIVNLILGRHSANSHGDGSRELAETVVFVIVLVLMLKLFVAEAFVIPTGSMASTLYGDQVIAICPECGYSSAVNASKEIGTVENAVCQNCSHYFRPTNPKDVNTGDRVLVSKFEYHLGGPKRYDVVVFKWPVAPFSGSEMTAMNYIKRLVGLPGETLAIYKGDLYRCTDPTLTYPPPPPGTEDRMTWWHGDHHAQSEADRHRTSVSSMKLADSRFDYLYGNDPTAMDLFQKGKFEIIRKGPTEMLAMRRLVFDTKFLPKSLAGPQQTRWQPADAGNGWTVGKGVFEFQGSVPGALDYGHIALEVNGGHFGWTNQTPPRQFDLITDFLAYNTQRLSYWYPQWVPDLMIECEGSLKTDDSTVSLQLTRGTKRYRAEFSNKNIRLVEFDLTARTERELAVADQAVSIGSNHKFRFTDFDSRLTVWLNGSVVNFDKPVDLASPREEALKSSEHDRTAPARIGATGTVALNRISLWRDVYCTHNYPGADPERVETYYVQPGHYFCMGDNSTSSSDGRVWGLVPERLMLGKAVVVYFPFSRMGLIK